MNEKTGSGTRGAEESAPEETSSGRLRAYYHRLDRVVVAAAPNREKAKALIATNLKDRGVDLPYPEVSVLRAQELDPWAEDQPETTVSDYGPVAEWMVRHYQRQVHNRRSEG